MRAWLLSVTLAGAVVGGEAVHAAGSPARAGQGAKACTVLVRTAGERPRPERARTPPAKRARPIAASCPAPERPQTARGRTLPHYFL